MPRRTVPLNRSALRLPISAHLDVERPASRGLTCINVCRPDKEAFDELQSYWSYRLGKPLAQWDTFTTLLVAAYHPDLADMPPRRVA